MSQNAELDDNEPSHFGKFSIYLTGGIGLVLTLISSSFVAPALRKHCLPFVPATDAQLRNILSLLPRGWDPQAKLLDIGSGDGRVVFRASQLGIESHGIEINFWLYLYSKLTAIKNNTAAKTHFFRGDLWKFNVSPYSHIVIFGVEQMMAELEKKLALEAKSGTSIIACRFPLPSLKPIKIIGKGIDTVWLYKMN